MSLGNDSTFMPVCAFFCDQFCKQGMHKKRYEAAFKTKNHHPIIQSSNLSSLCMLDQDTNIRANLWWGIMSLRWHKLIGRGKENNQIWCGTKRALEVGQMDNFDHEYTEFWSRDLIITQLTNPHHTTKKNNGAVDLLVTLISFVEIFHGGERRLFNYVDYNINTKEY